MLALKQQISNLGVILDPWLLLGLEDLYPASDAEAFVPFPGEENPGKVTNTLSLRLLQFALHGAASEAPCHPL